MLVESGNKKDSMIREDTLKRRFLAVWRLLLTKSHVFCLIKHGMRHAMSDGVAHKAT